ncbi:MAG: hypothetical protein ACON4J_08335 [Parvibaculales bacterium]
MTPDKNKYERDEIEWDEELLAKRRRRAKVTGFLLGAFVVLFFLITLVRLGANVVNRPL